MLKESFGNLIVNGKEIAIPQSGTTLEELLKQFHVSKENQGVAVAVNEQVIPKQQWESTTVQPGDNIEIVRAVQGG